MADISQHSVPRKAGLLISLFLAGLTAVLVTVAVPHFREVLSAFGADLPWLGRAVLSWYLAVWLLPAGVLVAWFKWPRASHRPAVAIAIGLLSALAILPVSLLALYLPIFKLGATV